MGCCKQPCLVSAYVCCPKSILAHLTFNSVLTNIYTIKSICHKYRPFYNCLLGNLAFEWHTSLLLLCKSSCSNANQVHLHDKSREVCIKQDHLEPRCHSNARSPSRQLRNGALSHNNCSCRRSFRSGTSPTRGQLCSPDL